MRSILITLLLSCSLNIFASMTESDYLDMLNTSRSVLNQQNMEIKLGELTGAGKTIPLQNLEVLFTEDNFILRNEIQEFNLKKGSQTVSGIKEVFTGQGLIKASELSGFIYSK